MSSRRRRYRCVARDGHPKPVLESEEINRLLRHSLRDGMDFSFALNESTGKPGFRLHACTCPRVSCKPHQIAANFKLLPHQLAVPHIFSTFSGWTRIWIAFAL
jgi:hypothetical protein